MKSKQIICFEFKNFVSVVGLPDFYKACFEPLHQKHGLFKIVLAAKNMCL